jgi:serine/threonine protein kinase
VSDLIDKILSTEPDYP